MSSAPTSSGSSRSRYAFYVLAILTLLNLLNYVDRFIFAALIPYIKDETGFTDAQMGQIGSAFTWIYTICSPTFGVLGDRYHRGRLIAFGIFIWSIATAAAGISRNFVHMLLSRTAVGVGEANYATIAPGLLSDFFAKAQRGMAMSIFFAAIPIGTAIGYLVGGTFGKPESLGWRNTLYLVGLPGLLAALLVFTVREPVRGAMDEKTSDEPLKTHGLVESVKLLLTNGQYVFACLGYAAVTFAVGALVFWAPEWLKTDKGISAERANAILGVCAVVGGSVGTLVGGAVGDALNRRIRGAYFWVCAAGAGLAVIPTLVAIVSATPIVYEVSIFIAITVIFLGNGPVNTIVVNAVPANLRTTATGLLVVIIHVLGDGVSLGLVGYISTWIRETVAAGRPLPGIVTGLGEVFSIVPANQSLSIALFLMPVALVVSAGFYLLGLKGVERKEELSA